MGSYPFVHAGIESQSLHVRRLQQPGHCAMKSPTTANDGLSQRATSVNESTYTFCPLHAGVVLSKGFDYRFIREATSAATWHKASEPSAPTKNLRRYGYDRDFA